MHHVQPRATPLGWLVGGLLLGSCATAPIPHGALPWPAADDLFRRDRRWLGGDAVYSVDLGGERILWLFGDSFVGLDGSRDRRTSTMVRNTLAIQQGRDPRTAGITFHWHTTAAGRPGAFFADDGAIGYWPLHGYRVPGGPLLLFQTRVRNTPGQGLGFAIEGWRLLRIDTPDVDPLSWRPVEVPVAPAPADITFGTTVAREGEHLLVLGTRGHGPHRGVLARFALRDLDAAVVPLEVWDTDHWASATASTPAREVLDDAGPECSVHRTGRHWLHVQSRGFGATTVAARTATQPTGPWSPPIDLFTPPESRGPRPFVYAGKAHPSLDAGRGWLAISYAANAWAFADLFTEKGQTDLYWPRFWRVATADLPQPD